MPIHLTVKGISHTKSVLLGASNDIETVEPIESIDHLFSLAPPNPVLRPVRGVMSDVILLVEVCLIRMFL